MCTGNADFSCMVLVMCPCVVVVCSCVTLCPILLWPHLWLAVTVEPVLMFDTLAASLKCRYKCWESHCLSFLWWVDEVLSKYVWLTWAYVCSRCQCLISMGMARPSSGTRTDVVSVCRKYWQQLHHHEGCSLTLVSYRNALSRLAIHLLVTIIYNNNAEFPGDSATSPSKELTHPVQTVCASIIFSYPVIVIKVKSQTLKVVAVWAFSRFRCTFMWKR